MDESRKVKKARTVTETQPKLRHDLISAADDDKRLTFPKAHGHPLLPGLLNDITLAHVVPKLG